MILSDKRIRELVLNEGLISPFIEDCLQSESYDVTIGDQLISFKRNIGGLDIKQQNDIDDIYQVNTISDEGYSILPKEYIMVALNETIKLPENITAQLRPKTAYNRLGLLVQSQHCNSTYSGELRVGIFNATDYPIRIRRGYPIAQLLFEEIQPVPSDEKLYKNKKNAHYQNEASKFTGAKFDDAFLDKIIREMLK